MRFRPESVLPFKVSEGNARDRIRAWYGRLWLAPSALKKRALTDTVRGIYLPYWTFDAQVDAQWTAEAGHYYYTTETYVENGQMRTRQVQQVRWEPAAGRLSHFFDDDLLCASVGVHPNILRGIEPFPTQDLKAVRRGLRCRLGRRALSDRPRRRGAARARRDGRQDADAVRARRCPATRSAISSSTATIRGRRSSTSSRRCGCCRTAYGPRSFQCAMNGVTGAIAGEYPKSPWKIALIVLAIIVGIVIAMSLGGGR